MQVDYASQSFGRRGQITCWYGALGQRMDQLERRAARNVVVVALANKLVIATA